jgi:hypothetical protein
LGNPLCNMAVCPAVLIIVARMSPAEPHCFRRTLGLDQESPLGIVCGREQMTMFRAMM